jgi:hypothetical protein
MHRQSNVPHSIPSAVAAWEGILAAELAQLQQSYTFRDSAAVLRFLEENPFLVPVLLEAPAWIAGYFAAPKLYLAILADPETGDENQLVLSIVINVPPDQALDQLQQFDEGWWLDVVSRTSGKLCIDVEYL